MHTLPQLLSPLTWKPEKLPGLCRQCKGEAPLNPTVTLNSESERGSTDFKCFCELLHTSAGQEGEGLTQPSNQEQVSCRPYICLTDTGHTQSGNSSLCSFHPAPTALLALSHSHPPTNHHFSPQSLLLLTLSPSLPECN